MKKLAILGILTAVSLFYPHWALPQSGEEFQALRKDLESVREGQKNIQKELEAIKGLLEQRPAPGAAQPQQPVNLVLSVDGAQSKGDKNAKVTLIEFTDFQCPFCSRHLNQTAPQIDQDYIKSGKVRYVLRDFPIQSIHPLAFKAAEAAHCASEQGKYWEMHEKLFGNQRALTPKDLNAHAEGLGIELSKFQKCLESGKFAAKIRKDLDDGQKAGVTGTPSFFLGLTDSKSSQIKAVRTIKGAQPYAAFKDAIESLLATK